MGYKGISNSAVFFVAMLILGIFLLANSYNQLSSIPYPCNSGWMCFDVNTLVYRNPACSFSNVTTCDYMCKNSSCINKSQEIVSEKYPNPTVSLFYFALGGMFLLFGFASTIKLFSRQSWWRKITKRLTYAFLLSQLLLFLGFIFILLITKPNLLFNSFESLQIGAISLVVTGFLFQLSKEDILSPYFKQILLITTMTSLIFFSFSFSVLFNNSFVGSISVVSSYAFWQISILDAGLLVGCLDFIFIPMSIFSLLYDKKRRVMD